VTVVLSENISGDKFKYGKYFTQMFSRAWKFQTMAIDHHPRLLVVVTKNLRYVIFIVFLLKVLEKSSFYPLTT